MQTISFYSKICVFVTHHVAYVCGGRSAVETPLLHAPGVRMTVVELTPSNEQKHHLALHTFAEIGFMP